MRYYKELDIDFSEIKEAILEDFNAKKMNVFWNNIAQSRLDILKRMFEPLNLTPVAYVLINASPKTYSIHSDISKQDLRINIPILNCEYSSTHFFKPKTEEIGQRQLKTFKNKWEFIKHKNQKDTPINEVDLQVFKAYLRIQKEMPEAMAVDDINQAGADSMRYDPNEMILVDQIRLTKPTILRIKEPHAVAVLKKHTPRLALTVGFEEDLEDIMNEIL